MSGPPRPGAPKRSVDMRSVTCVFVWLTFWLITVPAFAEPVTDYEEALKLSAQSGKPIFYFSHMQG